MSFTFRLCSAEASGWVLLFWWGLSFKFLGDFLIIDFHTSGWKMLVVRCGSGRGFNVLGKCFLYRDTLKDRFSFGFLTLDNRMMGEMLNVFCVNIGRCFLGFRRAVVLL